MTKSEFQTAWRCQHPIVKGMVGGGVWFVVATILFSLVPAWAVSVPIGSLVVDLGDLPPWIAAVVAVAIWWDARQAKKHAAEAAALAAAADKNIKAVAVQIDGLLADRDKANVSKGEQKEKQVGVETAATLAEGVRQGIEIGRASAPKDAALPAAGADDKRPLPVADDRVAIAGERVAAATERSAEAQTRVADATEEKK